MQNFIKTIINAVQSWTKKEIKNSTADWNQNDASAADYVKNRTHYRENVVIVPDTSVSQFHLFDNIAEDIIENEIYQVIFDDEIYECCATSGMFTSINDQQYFFIEYYNDAIAVFMPNNKEHTISIQGPSIKKLPSVYMPDDIFTRQRSFNFGNNAIASGKCSHAEGDDTTASGFWSHAEGGSTTASNSWSHAEGFYTTASGMSSHAEGNNTTASGDFSHAEGLSCIASEACAHAEGDGTQSSGHASHAEGSNTIVTSDTSVSISTTSSTIKGDAGHAEGYGTVVCGRCAHAEGNGTKASGADSHAEGYLTTASGSSSHAEGDSTTASGAYSHAEGYDTTASGFYSHAEGNNTEASNNNAHAEGSSTIASGDSSHAEGSSTIASRLGSHAEGGSTTASGDCSHAEGIGTIAQRSYQHVQGKCNIADTVDSDPFGGGKYAHIVGNGTSDTERSNAHTLDWSGVGWFQGGLQVGGTEQDGEGVGYVPAISSAQVGQTIVVSEVDENGKPTKWEAADMGSSDAIVYTEQTLSDEQKNQARQNISAVGYSFHETGMALGELDGYFFANNYDGRDDAYASYCILDWDKALSLASVNSPSNGLIYHMNTQIFSIVGYNSYIDSDGKKDIIVKHIMPNMQKLIEEGCLNPTTEGGAVYAWDYIYTLNTADVLSYKHYRCLYNTAGLIRVSDQSTGFYVQYYNGAITNDEVKPEYDTTLTISGTAADAKAVGDALAALSAQIPQGSDTKFELLATHTISEADADTVCLEWNDSNYPLLQNAKGFIVAATKPADATGNKWIGFYINGIQVGSVSSGMGTTAKTMYTTWVQKNGDRIASSDATHSNTSINKALNIPTISVNWNGEVASPIWPEQVASIGIGSYGSDFAPIGTTFSIYVEVEA